MSASSRGARCARSRGFDVVAAVGGGSVLDAAKAVAAFAANPGDPLDYLEIVGRGRPLTSAPLPVVAIPTTAGTGSEVTRNAVLSVPEPRVKVSLRHPLMLPRVAIVDPALTDDLPPSLTATTGLDALTQLIEPFLSSRATPLTDALCRSGIPRIARSLRRACEHAGDTWARDDMALGSLLGAWRSPTPDWEPCTVWPRRSAACSACRTVRSAPRCCLTCAGRTCARCARGTRPLGARALR